MKAFFKFFIIAGALPLLAERYAEYPIIQISPPKTGTHLAQKALKLITGKQPIIPTTSGMRSPDYLYRISAEEFRAKPYEGEKKFYYNHLMYDAEFAAIFKEKNYRIIFTMRDPRDQIISYIHWIRRNYQKHREVLELSVDELIMDLICKSSMAHGNPPAAGIADLYQKYMPWMHEPNVQVVRFEDLVGSQGGGSDEKQVIKIKEMASHIGYDLSDDEVRNIAHELWGGSLTFREGKIGSWKQYFNDEHKKSFKEVAGQLLVDLGYEKDFNW